MNCDEAIKILEALAGAEELDESLDEGEAEESENQEDIEVVLDRLIQSNWETPEEYARFFIACSNSLDWESEATATMFGCGINYSFYPGTAVWDLWTKARAMHDVVERVASTSSRFNVIPAILKATYETQSLGEWLAQGRHEYSHEDNELLCTLISFLDDDDEAALTDIACNLGSTTALDELVFRRPELICKEQFLIDSMYGRGLLDNGALSADALAYLAALVLDASLPPSFTGATIGNTQRFTPTENEVSHFRDTHRESLQEMDSEAIVEAVTSHPNCPEGLKSHLTGSQARRERASQVAPGT